MQPLWYTSEKTLKLLYYGRDASVEQNTGLPSNSAFDLALDQTLLRTIIGTGISLRYDQLSIAKSLLAIMIGQ